MFKAPFPFVRLYICLVGQKNVLTSILFVLELWLSSLEERLRLMNTFSGIGLVGCFGFIGPLR